MIQHWLIKPSLIFKVPVDKLWKFLCSKWVKSKAVGWNRLHVNEKMVFKSTAAQFIDGKRLNLSHSNNQQMAWYYSAAQQASPGGLELIATIYLDFGEMAKSWILIFDNDRNFCFPLCETDILWKVLFHFYAFFDFLHGFTVLTSKWQPDSCKLAHWLIQTKDRGINKCHFVKDKGHCMSYRWTIPENSSHLRLMTQQLRLPHVKEVSLTKSTSCAYCSSHIQVTISPIQRAAIRDQGGTVLRVYNLKSYLEICLHLTFSLHNAVSPWFLDSCAPSEWIHRQARLEESIRFSKITYTRLNLSTVHFNQSGICRHTVQDTGVYLGVIHC